MVPLITNWEDLTWLSEVSDPNTGEFQYTTFAVVDDDSDTIHRGDLSIPKDEITIPQLISALHPIPDEVIFPEYPSSDTELTLTRAPEVLPADIYIKRPKFEMYDVYKKYNVVHLIPQGLIDEAKTMQVISQHPHPNIIRYHGCRVQRGRITGLVLDRHPSDLNDYLKNGGSIDKEPFMEALESAIHHLHSVGWAHNDLNPGNVLVNKAGMPVLIDFDSSQEVGKKLGTSRGNPKWIDGDIKDYTMSEKRHDLSALEKVRAWLDKPTFDG